MRTFLVAALLVALALSGCTDGKKDDGDDGSGTSSPTGTASGSKSGTASKTGTSTGSTSQTGTGQANRAPTGTIAATVNGTGVTFALTGLDADGDALSWTLAFGDGQSTNGTTLPTNVTHTYAAGNHTALYNVTDGKLTARYNVSVAVQAGGGAPLLTFSGDVENYCAFCTEVLGGQDGSEPASPFPSVSWMSDDPGIDAVWVEVPAALAGRPWSATTTGVDIAVAAFTGCSPDSHFLQMVDTGANPEVGTVPAGTGCFVLWEFLSVYPPPLGEPSDPTAGAQTLALVIS